MRVSFALTMVTVVWLLSWVLAGGIRAQQLARDAAEGATEPLRAGAPAALNRAALAVRGRAARPVAAR